MPAPPVFFNASFYTANPAQPRAEAVAVIDRCPKCNGVWLDAGEFERMSSDAVTQAVVAMSRSAGYIG